MRRPVQLAPRTIAWLAYAIVRAQNMACSHGNKKVMAGSLAVGIQTSDRIAVPSIQIDDGLDEERAQHAVLLLDRDVLAG